jgi:hypothetical protein
MAGCGRRETPQKERLKMKTRNLIVMVLAGLLGFGMFVACDDGSSGSGDSGNNNTPSAKVVEEKYRGNWYYEGDLYFTLTENTHKAGNTIQKVFTEGNKLYWNYNNVLIEEPGTFTSDTTFVYKDSDFTITKAP